MKPIAWLAGVGTLVASGIYMLVSLNRWEWNRALFFGLIVVIAEIGLATGLILRRLGPRATPAPTDAELRSAVRDARPPEPARFRWLKESASGELNVFITFLVGGGVILSVLAWLLDRLAAATTTPLREARLARKLQAISYPRGGLLPDRPLVRALRHPG